MAIKMRTGNEVDFDPNKMIQGEWAVSVDKKYVRMCFAAGVCLRMATYEAFESDMEKISDILEECRTIDEAVTRIHAEVNANADLVVENTKKAKEYMEQAKLYAENAEAITGVSIATKDKAGLVKPGESAVDEDGTLVMVRKASGTAFTMADSYEGGFEDVLLFGRSEQKTYTGKNLLENKATSLATNGVTYTVNDDGSVITNGTATGSATLVLHDGLTLTPSESVILSGCPSGGSSSGYFIALYNSSWANIAPDYGSGKTFTVPDDGIVNVRIRVLEGTTVSNLVFKPMIRLATVTDVTYEPYVGGQASPNPSYPQEIESAENVDAGVFGKNILKNHSGTTTQNGITFTLIDDGSVIVNGTATDNAFMFLADQYNVGVRELLLGKKLILSGCPSGGSSSTYRLQLWNYDGKKINAPDTGSGVTFTFTNEDGNFNIVIIVYSGATVSNLVFKPMLRLAEVEDSTYEPYNKQPLTLNRVLRGIPVTDASLATYTDKNGQMWCADYVSKKRKVLVQNIKRRILTSSMTWHAATTNENVWIYTADVTDMATGRVDRAYKLSTGISNAFGIGETPDDVTNGTENTMVLWYGISYSGYRLGLYSSQFQTVDEWKAYLDENEVYVDYPLATPIEIPLTDEEIAALEALYSNYPVTTVISDVHTEVEYPTSRVGGIAVEANQRSKKNDRAIGTADISAIGDGTVKGAISELNTSKAKVQAVITTNGFSTMSADIYNQWPALALYEGVIEVINGANIYHGTYYKYTDTVGSILMTDAADGTVYVWCVSGENNYSLREVAKADEYLPLTGGTLTGNLVVPNVVCFANNGFVGSYGNEAFLEALDDTNNKRQISVSKISSNSDLAQSLKISEVINGVWNSKNIFGEHNKPTGVYTGNGSATARTINTGGIGDCIMVWSHNGTIAIVGTAGGCIGAIQGTPTGLNQENAYISNGTLIISTDSRLLNENGVYYNYRVL